jgi:FG-GAP-like repeat/RTX calcium-binding nonapeptide repeat (4 copies)/FG-GAP repeat
MFSRLISPSHRVPPKKSSAKGHLRLLAAVEALETRVLLASTATGFDFGYAEQIPIPQVDQKANRPFGGLVVADLANNGKDDIAFFGNEGMTVLMGNGDSTFQAPVVYPVPNGNPVEYAAIASADVNGDGSPDIILVQGPAKQPLNPNNSGSVVVFLNNGNGTFKPAELYPGVGPQTDALAVASLSPGALPDIVATNYYNRTVTILLNNGNGTFSPNYETLAVGNTPSAVGIADMNGDGLPDIVVGNNSDDTVSILLNNGDGTFKPQYVVPIDGAGEIALADINGATFADGGPIDDIVTEDGVLINTTTPGGPFTFSPVYSNTGDAILGKVDIKGDGLDRLTADYDYQIVDVELGNTDGTFGPPDRLYSTITPASSTVLTANSSAAPTAQSHALLGYGPDFIQAADINGDGLPDLVVADYGINPGRGRQDQPAGEDYKAPAITIFIANADATFEGQRVTELGRGVDSNGYPTTGKLASNAYPNLLAVGDINGDGFPDVVSANYGIGPAMGPPVKVSNYPGSINVMLNDGDGRMVLSQYIPDAYGPDGVVEADFTGDGFKDLAVINHFNGQLEVFQGYGNGSFNTTASFTTYVGNHPVSIAVGDLNGDGTPDIVVASYGTASTNSKAGTSGQITILLNEGNFNFTPASGSPIADAYGPSAVTISSFGNVAATLGPDAGQTVVDIAYTDRLTYSEDVAIGGTGATLQGDGSVKVLFGNGDGTFLPAESITVGVGPGAVVAADFNGNAAGNFMDLAVLNETSDSLTILAGNADGTFFTEQVYDFLYYPDTGNPPTKPNALDSSPIGIGVADMNGDGFPDVLVTYANPAKYYNGATQKYFPLTVGVMLNQGTSSGKGLLQPPTTYTETSKTIVEKPNAPTTTLMVVQSVPVAVAGVDVNGDGKPDIVVLNSTGGKYYGTLTELIANANATSGTGNTGGTGGSGGGNTGGTSGSGGTHSTGTAAPVFTSSTSTTFTVGVSGLYIISATGAAAISETGALPTGVTETANNNGTLTIFGTPAAGTVGVYDLTVTATGNGSTTETFVLNVSTPQISAGNEIVNLTGTAGADTITLTVSGTILLAQVNSQEQTYVLNTIAQIDITALAGTDSISIGAGVPAVYAHGGRGADTIIANNSADDTLAGGRGKDSIQAGSGNDSLVGGVGTDTLLAGTGNDTLMGGPGNDSLTGGPGNDLLDGGPGGSDTVIGGGPNNTVIGGGGNDSLVS